MNIIPKYFKFFKDCVEEKHVILRGSSRSAKTYSILQWFYFMAISGVKFELTIVGRTKPFLRDGAFNTFRQIAPKEKFISNPFRVKIRNAVILFRSFENEEDAKGSERDFLYLNECNDLDFKIVQQLVMRTRIQTFYDFNPTKRFWIDEFQNKKNLLYTTWKDNLYLSEAQKENFKRIKERAEKPKASAYDKYLYSVYYLGEYGDLSGNVFSNFEEIDEETYSNVCGSKKLYCLDFGFSEDPAALVELSFNNEKYIAKELLYKSGLNDFRLAEILREVIQEDAVCVCDWGGGGDARISNLFELTGISFAKAVKGAGSIKNGVELMNSKEFLLLGENINREFKGYEFKDGEFIDKENHTIDATRYGLDYAIRSDYFSN